MKVPAIKNGAKGTSLFNPFFFNTNKTNPIMAPKRNDRNNATKILGNPTKKPSNMASFTSPNPIQDPLEIKKIVKKNPAAKHAANKKDKKVAGFIR